MTKTTIREGGRKLVVEQIVAVRGKTVTVRILGQRGEWEYPVSALYHW